VPCHDRVREWQRARRAVASEEAHDVSIALQERIVVFLMKNRGRPFCDDCISRELSAPVNNVRRETEKMKTWAGFLPANTVCLGGLARCDALRCMGSDGARRQSRDRLVPLGRKQIHWRARRCRGYGTRTERRPVGFERGPASVASGPSKEMIIRVTHIDKRDGAGWRLVHRHADFPPPDQRKPSQLTNEGH
jgi:hypothetical protein